MSQGLRAGGLIIQPNPGCLQYWYLEVANTQERMPESWHPVVRTARNMLREPRISSNAGKEGSDIDTKAKQAQAEDKGRGVI